MGTHRMAKAVQTVLGPKALPNEGLSDFHAKGVNFTHLTPADTQKRRFLTQDCGGTRPAE
jgi:hypothetical protein